MPMSSASASDETLLALGPANQPVSTGYSSGYWVHQVGTAASESRNDRSDRSRSPRSAHHVVAKRKRILTTLPNPISAAAVARWRAAVGSAISDRSGGGTLRIAASASNVAPWWQRTATRLLASSIAVTAAPRWSAAPCLRHSDARYSMIAP